MPLGARLAPAESGLSHEKEGKGSLLLSNPNMVAKKLLDEQVQLNKELAATNKDLKHLVIQYQGTVWCWCGEIAAELSRKLSIDTGRPPGRAV